MRPLPILIGCLLLSACTKDSPAAAAPPPPEEAKPKADAPSKSPDTDEYHVALAARGPYQAGVAASAPLTVTAKNGFHVNPEYPMAFKPEGHQAVQFPAERLKLTWGDKKPCPTNAEDACEVEVLLPVTPAQTGNAVVAGVVAFSVCNPERCLIQKIPVSVAIEVQ